MEPIFKKCLTAITQINEQLLPEMGHLYNKFINDAKIIIINSQCLNEARKFSKAAIEAQNSGLIDNKNIKKYLEFLKGTDEKLNNRSRYLNRLMSDIKYKFIKKSKEIARKNHYYLSEMKNGTIPAKELLVMIVALGKDIQKIIREELPGYKKELQVYIKKAEGTICDDAYKYYNKIIKLDDGTFPVTQVREWTHLPDALLRTSGVFVHDTYEI